MSLPRLSFTAWLKEHHGVISMRENTSRFGDIRNDAVINYNFSNIKDARKFAGDVKIVAHPTRDTFKNTLDDQVVFNDPLNNPY